MNFYLLHLLQFLGVFIAVIVSTTSQANQMVTANIVSVSQNSHHSKPLHQDPIPEDKTTYLTELLWPDIVIPWGMVQLPNGQLLATEREGKLWLLTENEPSIEISGLPNIHNNRQGGLLDIALHPKFKNNQVIFFTYSTNEGGGSNTALMRAQVDFKKMKLIDKKLLYKGEGGTNRGTHYGSRITILGEQIYFSIGDRGNRDQNPQNIKRDGGKIYRLNLDGSIPSGNPFYNNLSMKQAIYSYGHRNPQGLISIKADSKNGEQIWSHEHGPQGGDEVNLIESGKNYGWPVISYGVNYGGSKLTDLVEKEGMEQPKLFWNPSIAPSGMTYVTSDKYPQWQGKILLGSLKFNHVVALDIDNKKVIKQRKILSNLGGRVRNIIQGSDGYIYIGVDGKGILRLLPK